MPPRRAREDVCAERNVRMRLLASVANLGGTSDSALSGILEQLKRANRCDLEHTSRATIRRSQEYVLALETAYGTVIRSTQIVKHDGTEFTWEHVDPAAALNFLVQESPEFNDVMWASYQSSPPTPINPWDIIVYEDDVSSGNVLRVDNTRKVGALYWAFAQFGYEILSHVAGWLLGGIIRTHNYKQVRGGLSAVFAVFLQSFSALPTTSPRAASKYAYGSAL